MSQKRIILSDSSLNRYGYRVLTEGLHLEAFKKNPIMLYMHFRDEGSPLWGESKAIGHWEDIQVNGDELSAIPVFDKVDDLSKTIAAKYEAGTYNAVSIGFRIIATSANKELLVAGQTRETITESELMEVSIVDVPGNSNAVRLYDTSTSVLLAAGMDTNSVPALPIPFKEKTMNLKASWTSFLALLGIEKEKAETTELSAENIEAIHTEMHRLKTENGSLVQAKTEIDGKLAAANTEITALKADAGTKDTEITRLKSEGSTKDSEILQLKEQVQNLKNGPTPVPAPPAPKKEPEGESDKGTLAAFCDENSGNYQTITDKLKAEGLLL